MRVGVGAASSPPAKPVADSEVPTGRAAGGAATGNSVPRSRPTSPPAFDERGHVEAGDRQFGAVKPRNTRRPLARRVPVLGQARETPQAETRDRQPIPEKEWLAAELSRGVIFFGKTARFSSGPPPARTAVSRTAWTGFERDCLAISVSGNRNSGRDWKGAGGVGSCRLLRFLVSYPASWCLTLREWYRLMRDQEARRDLLR